MLLKPCFCNLYVFSTDILKKIIIIIFLFFSVVNKFVFCRIVCTFVFCLYFYKFKNILLNHDPLHFTIYTSLFWKNWY